MNTYNQIERSQAAKILRTARANGNTVERSKDECGMEYHFETGDALVVINRPASRGGSLCTVECILFES